MLSPIRMRSLIFLDNTSMFTPLKRLKTAVSPAVSLPACNRVSGIASTCATSFKVLNFRVHTNGLHNAATLGVRMRLLA